MGELKMYIISYFLDGYIIKKIIVNQKTEGFEPKYFREEREKEIFKKILPNGAVVVDCESICDEIKVVKDYE